jgi:hypothetical protein
LLRAEVTEIIAADPVKGEHVSMFFLVSMMVALILGLTGALALVTGGVPVPWLRNNVTRFPVWG